MAAMIYTIGEARTYDAVLRRARGPVFRRGRSLTDPGAIVFATREEAEAHLRLWALAGQKVYGLLADWDENTRPSAGGPYRYLLNAAQVVGLPEEAGNDGREPAGAHRAAMRLWRYRTAAPAARR